MIKGIRINKSKVVHLYWVAADRTDCGAGGMSDISCNGGVETTDAVTCKRCLREVAAIVEADHVAALAENEERAQSAALVEQERAEAAMPVAHWSVVRTPSEGVFVLGGVRRMCDVLVDPKAGTHEGPCFDALDRLWQREPVTPSRRKRRAARRQQRATLRAQAPQMAAAARARRGERRGLPQTARTLLAASGVPDDMAKRYAPAFSKGVEADATRSVRVRMCAGRSKRSDVKLYRPETFEARLSTYRPRDPFAALVFAAAAS